MKTWTPWLAPLLTTLVLAAVAAHAQPGDAATDPEVERRGLAAPLLTLAPERQDAAAGGEARSSITLETRAPDRAFRLEAESLSGHVAAQVEASPFVRASSDLAGRATLVISISPSAPIGSEHTVLVKAIDVETGRVLSTAKGHVRVIAAAPVAGCPGYAYASPCGAWAGGCGGWPAGCGAPWWPAYAGCGACGAWAGYGPGYGYGWPYAYGMGFPGCGQAWPWYGAYPYAFPPLPGAVPLEGVGAVLPFPSPLTVNATALPAIPAPSPYGAYPYPLVPPTTNATST